MGAVFNRDSTDGRAYKALLQIKNETGNNVDCGYTERHLKSVTRRNEPQGKIKKLVSVIIPAFNEEQTIGQVLEALQVLPIEKQIIVVNDGSTDGTSNVLEELLAVYELTVVHCEENRGKGLQFGAGLPYVMGEVVVIQDRRHGVGSGRSL